MNGPAEQKAYEAEAHASATLLAILMLLWGAVALPLVPPVFQWLDCLHLGIGVVGTIYFLATRSRPRTFISYLFCAAVIVFALMTLPWTTVVWCRVHRPFEAVAVPQLAMLCMALIVPRSFVLGLAVTALFMAEGVFVTLWANQVGEGARLPIGEPVITVLFGIPAVALLLLRDKRRSLVGRYIALEAETDALGRLGPLFSRVRDELRTQVAVLSRALEGAPATSAPMDRAVGRLADVNARLADLVETGPVIDTAAERLFVARDTQLGATMFAGIVALLAVAWTPIAALELGKVVAMWDAAIGVVALATFAALWATAQRPSEARGRLGVLVVFTIILIGVAITQFAYRDLTRPFTPFVGPKLVVVILGVAAASWSWMGVLLILTVAAEALVLWFVLGFGALGDRVAVGEPWTMLVFAVVGVLALAMRDQRRVASLAVLREESAASALHRRALLLLGLRDQLNTPLQTLVAGAAWLELQAPSLDLSTLQSGIARLVALSRELAQIEVPSESQVASPGEPTVRQA